MKKIILLVFVTTYILGEKASFVLAQANVDTKGTASSADTRGTATEADTRGTATEADVRTTAPSTIFTLQNPLRSDINSIGALVQAFVEIITYIAIIFAVLAFIWVGFQYVTNAATGNAKKIQELHNQLMWLVVGVAVVISARVIIQVVINTISATGTVSPTVIQSANDALQGR